MVGLFDSGSGGLNTVRYIKRYAPDVDLVYLIDKERAPYGTKTKKELIEITEDNIEKLLNMGAERVLIACCTASTVHPLIDKKLNTVSIPIISEVAKHAQSATRSGRIGVISTEHTARSHAFKRLLRGYEVHELGLSELVAMIDGGLTDETVTDTQEKELTKMLTPIFAESTDTLILGCTHFPSLKNTIEKIVRPYGIESVIDSARIGADLIAKAARSGL